jgi:hypothetical protein
MRGTVENICVVDAQLPHAKCDGEIGVSLGIKRTQNTRIGN